LIRLKANVANKGVAEGPAIICRKPFSFNSINPATGTVDIMGHELSGKLVSDKIIVCPCGCGVSNEDRTLYILRRAKAAPLAIIYGRRIFYIHISGAIHANIPMVYGLDQNCLNLIRDGDHVKVDANFGFIEVTSQV